MNDYTPPKWMMAPQAQWRLDEIKSGVIVNSYDIINVPLVIFGRTAPALLVVPPAAAVPTEEEEEDKHPSTQGHLFILTAHESCSRLHARIAFDSNGIPWLRDLGSGNGTKVNKKLLPKKSVGKMENLKGEGSRGVMIFPGDMLQFGASTRIFVLEGGPSNFNRGSIKAMQQQQQQQQQQQRHVQQEQIIKHEKDLHPDTRSNNDEEKEEGITWGISFHDHHVESDDANLQPPYKNPNVSTSDMESSNLSEKHQKLYNAIQSKKYKLSNIQNEMQRIQSKAATVDLTTGQTKQLETLEQREQGLLQEISDLEMTLRERMEMQKSNRSNHHHDSKSLKRQSQLQEDHHDYYYDDDDVDDDVDEFYDKTTTTSNAAAHKRIKIQDANNNQQRHHQQQQQQQQDVETEESLISKCKKLFAQYKSWNHKITLLETKIVGFKKRLSAMNPNEEDYFYTKNDLDLIVEEHAKAIENVKKVEKEIDEIQLLLKVVNENIIVDKDQSFVGHVNATQQQSARRRTDGSSAIFENDVKVMDRRTSDERMPAPSAVFQKQNVIPSLSMPPPTVTTTTSSSSASSNNTAAPPPSSSSSPQLPQHPSPQHPSPQHPQQQPQPPRIMRGPARPQQSSSSGATLSFLSSCSSTSSTATPALNKAILPNNNTTKCSSDDNDTTHATNNHNHNHNDNDSPPKTDHWVAPSNQDGSGYTKLNEKFRGRY